MDYDMINLDLAKDRQRELRRDASRRSIMGGRESRREDASISTKLTLALSSLTLAAIFLGLIFAGTALAERPAQESEAPVFWSWDFIDGNTDNPVGYSHLVRTASGISAQYKTDVLRAGNTATLWFIVFNDPTECVAGPYLCSPLDLGPDAAAQGDFLLASGQVIGRAGKGNFGGHLNVGDTSGSGYAEVNCPDTMDCAPGLIDPEGALVVLAIHDHGPRQTGETLVDQISSFLGGCVGPFNGNEFGFATGLEDIPDADGECSTTQFSPHPPD